MESDKIMPTRAFLIQDALILNAYNIFNSLPAEEDPDIINQAYNVECFLFDMLLYVSATLNREMSLRKFSLDLPGDEKLQDFIIRQLMGDFSGKTVELPKPYDDGSPYYDAIAFIDIPDMPELKIRRIKWKGTDQIRSSIVGQNNFKFPPDEISSEEEPTYNA